MNPGRLCSTWAIGLALVASVSACSVDRAMRAENADDPTSVTHPGNYSLFGDATGQIPIRTASYDSLFHTVELTFDPLEADQYQLVISSRVTSAEDTPLADPFVSEFAALADFERSLIRERTKAGLEVAAARGRKGGRRSVVTPGVLKRARDMMDKGLTVRQAAAALKIGKTPLYEALRAADEAAGSGSGGKENGV